MDEIKIKIDNVKKIYKGQSGKETVALNGVNLEIKQNEFVCVVGPSGCGKTTLLNIIAGLERADEGKVYLDGEEVMGPGNDRGVIFQQYALFPWLTVRKNIEFGLTYVRIRDTKTAVNKETGKEETVEYYRPYTKEEMHEISDKYM